MTSKANRAFDTLPNVLYGQTIPNTLAGLGPPNPPARLRLPVGAVVAAVALTLAMVAILVGGPA